MTERFYSLRYESYSVFHVLEAKAARFQSQVFTLSPKASCVQVQSLATIVQFDGTFVTDRFESLRYESYFSLNISEAQFASFHLQCLCCHQKSAVCKYTSLATTVKSSGVLVTLLRSTVYGMLLEGLLEAGNSQPSCLLRVCDGADVPLHQPCLQIRRRRFHSLPAVFRGLPCAMMQVQLCWKGTITML